MKTVTFFLCFVFYFGVSPFAAYTQNQGSIENSLSQIAEESDVKWIRDSAGDSFTQNSPRDDPQKAMSAYLKRKGMHDGLNEKKGKQIIIQQGSAGVMQDYGTSGWVTSRMIALQKAELRARAEIANSIALAITEGRGMDIFEGDPDPEVTKKAAWLSENIEKVKALTGAKLDELLRKEGVNPSDYETKEEKIAEVTEKFTQDATILACQRLSGCQIFHITEGEWKGQYSVFVAIVWSENLAKLSAIVKNARNYSLPKERAKKTVENTVPHNEKALISELGCRVYIDDKGHRVLVGYGQAAPRIRSKKRAASAYMRAYGKAYIQAVSAIKHFVYEETDSKLANKMAEEFKNYGGEEATNKVVEKYHQVIKSKSTSLPLRGITKYREWDSTLADGKTPICGCIVYWSPDTQAGSFAMEKRIEEANLETQTEGGKRALFHRKRNSKAKISGPSGPAYQKVLESSDADDEAL